LVTRTTRTTSNSIYAGPRVLWLSALLGGAMFGFGMVLASGCGSKNLLRLGSGLHAKNTFGKFGLVQVNLKNALF
jgi:uncharacterized membrane protein YedE/YeeE